MLENSKLCRNAQSGGITLELLWFSYQGLSSQLLQLDLGLINKVIVEQLWLSYKLDY